MACNVTAHLVPGARQVRKKKKPLAPKIEVRVAICNYVQLSALRQAVNRDEKRNASCDSAVRSTFAD